VECIYLAASANTTIEAAERDTFLLVDNVLEEGNGSPQRHTLDRVGCFPRVLNEYNCLNMG